MKQLHETLAVRTRLRALVEITDSVQQVVDRAGISSGSCTIAILHTSASLLVNENADRDVRLDLEAFLTRLVPDGDALYRHVAEGPDDMSAHVKAALTQTSLVLPVLDGRLRLGTWQGVFVWEHRNVPHERRVAVHVWGQ